MALSISLAGFGFFSDWIGEKKLVKDTLSRKIFESIALGGPAICLFIVPEAPCNLIVLITLLMIGMIIFGLNAGGDKPIVVDIAPDHSGTIYGITNAFASLPGILSPLVVGFLIDSVSQLEKVKRSKTNNFVCRWERRRVGVGCSTVPVECIYSVSYSSLYLPLPKRSPGE